MVVERSFGPMQIGIHGRDAMHDLIVDRSLWVAAAAAYAPQPLGVGLVGAKQELRGPVADQAPDTELVMLGHHSRTRRVVADDGNAIVVAPGPGVAKPLRRDEVKVRGVAAGVGHGVTDEGVFRVALGGVDRDLPIALGFEDAAIDELERAMA